MAIDDKTILELASQLGLSTEKGRKDKNNTQRQSAEGIAKETVKRLEGKSDEELIDEIMKIKKQLTGNKIPKEKQIEMVKNLMPMMSGQQKTRLLKIIELLNS